MRRFGTNKNKQMVERNLLLLQNLEQLQDNVELSVNERFSDLVTEGLVFNQDKYDQQLYQDTAHPNYVFYPFKVEEIPLEEILESSVISEVEGTVFLKVGEGIGYIKKDGKLEKVEISRTHINDLYFAGNVNRKTNNDKVMVDTPESTGCYGIEVPRDGETYYVCVKYLLTCDTTEFSIRPMYKNAGGEKLFTKWLDGYEISLQTTMGTEYGFCVARVKNSEEYGFQILSYVELDDLWFPTLDPDPSWDDPDAVVYPPNPLREIMKFSQILSVKDDLVNGESLADSSITSNKIRDNSITNIKIHEESLANEKIADATIKNTSIKDNTFKSGDRIDDGAILPPLIKDANNKLKISLGNTFEPLETTNGVLKIQSITNLESTVSDTVLQVPDNGIIEEIDGVTITVNPEVSALISEGWDPSVSGGKVKNTNVYTDTKSIDLRPNELVKDEDGIKRASVFVNKLGALEQIDRSKVFRSVNLMPHLKAGDTVYWKNNKENCWNKIETHLVSGDWQGYNSGSTSALRGIAVGKDSNGNEVWVASTDQSMNSSSFRVKYSLDNGTTWILSNAIPKNYTPSGSTTPEGVIYIKEFKRFFVVGDDMFAYSDNGIKWTQCSGPGVNAFKIVSYFNGGLIAGGVASTTSGAGANSNNFATSNNRGLNWTVKKFTNFVTIYKITIGLGVTVLATNTGIFTLDNSNNVTKRFPLSGNLDITAVGYGDNGFVAFGNTGILYYSSNGTNWTAIGSANSKLNGKYVRTIIFNKGTYIAVADGGVVVELENVSSTGYKLTILNAGFGTSNITDIAFNDLKMMAVTVNGQIRGSSLISQPIITNNKVTITKLLDIDINEVKNSEGEYVYALQNPKPCKPVKFFKASDLKRLSNFQTADKEREIEIPLVRPTEGMDTKDYIAIMNGWLVFSGKNLGNIGAPTKPYMQIYKNAYGLPSLHPTDSPFQFDFAGNTPSDVVVSMPIKKGEFYRLYYRDWMFPTSGSEDGKVKLMFYPNKGSVR